MYIRQILKPIQLSPMFQIFFSIFKHRSIEVIHVQPSYNNSQTRPFYKKLLEWTLFLATVHSAFPAHHILWTFVTTIILRHQAITCTVKEFTLQHKFSSKIFWANEISLTRDKELDMYNKKSSMMSPSCYFLLAVESDGIHIGIDGSSCVTSPLFLGLFMPEWFALCILEVTVGSLPPGTWSSPLQKFTKHSASFTKYNDTNTVQQDKKKITIGWFIYFLTCIIVYSTYLSFEWIVRHPWIHRNFFSLHSPKGGVGAFLQKINQLNLIVVEMTPAVILFLN